MPTQGHLPGRDSASLGTWFGEAVGVKPGIHAPEARVESGLEVQSMCSSGNVEAIWKRDERADWKRGAMATEPRDS